MKEVYQAVSFKSGSMNFPISAFLDLLQNSLVPSTDKNDHEKPSGY